VAFIVCLALFLKSPRAGFVFLLACMIAAELCILVIGLSLRKSYLGSRDVVARYGAKQIVALLDLLLLEGELDEAMIDFKEIDALIAKAKSLLNGDKGRRMILDSKTGIDHIQGGANWRSARRRRGNP
jgi:hypothetical protein